MKIDKKTVVITSIFAITVWVLEALAHTVLFLEGSFLHNLLPFHNTHELYMRFLIFLVIITGGWVMARIVHLRQELTLIKEDREKRLNILFNHAATIAS